MCSAITVLNIPDIEEIVEQTERLDLSHWTRVRKVENISDELF